MSVAERFAANLVAARERANLSQESLALLASLHRTEIGLLERAGRTPRIDTLVRLAGALSIPPADLLKGIVWRPGSVKQGDFRCT